MNTKLYQIILQFSVGPKWLKYSKGEKCSDAIVGGNRTPMNETLYIARRQINENLLPGKLVPSQKLAFIPLFLGEHSFPDYEVRQTFHKNKKIIVNYI